jgi:transcriptional regulator with XRE-family HTH domain
MNWYAMTDLAILQKVGRSIQQVRLNQNVSQQELATRTGLSRRTVGEVEGGRPASLLTFVQLLRGLGRLDILDSFESSAVISPLQAARLARQQRHRASRQNDNSL